MGKPVRWMGDSCRRAVGGNIREEPIIKGLKKPSQQIQLASALNEESESTVMFAELTKMIHVEAHMSNV